MLNYFIKTIKTPQRPLDDAKGGGEISQSRDPIFFEINPKPITLVSEALSPFLKKTDGRTKLPSGRERAEAD